MQQKLSLWPKTVYSTLLLLLVSASASVAALDVTVEASPNPAQPGEAMRVAITVTNPGGSSSGPITLQLPYPADLASVSELYVSDGGGCSGTSCEAPETIVWSLPALAPGEGATVTLAPLVLSGAADGATILFDVDALESGSPAASVQTEVNVATSRFFDVVVDENREPVPAGATLGYEITYGNRSPETSTDTELSFDVPAGTTFLGASNGGVFSNGTVTWDLGTVAGHEGGRLSVVVRVGAGQGEGAILEGAAATISGDGDFAPHSSEASAVTRVENGGRLIVAMAVNPDPAFQGESLRASILVTNPGTSFANNVELKLRFPENLSSHGEDFISDGGDCSGTSCEPREELFWNLGNLPPGRGVAVTLAPSVASVAGGSLITFPIAVKADGQSRTLARQSLIVRDTRIFDLAVDAERSPAGSGEELAYTIVYGNRSTEATDDTTLRFPLPGGTSFVSASGAGTLAGNTVVWNLGTLAGRQGGQRQVRVLLGTLAEGTHLAIDPARIGGQGDFLAHETRARSLTRVENDTRLDVAVTLDHDPVFPEERTSVRATVSNRSMVDFANNVVLRWRAPTGFNSVSDGGEMLGGDCTGTSCEAREIATFDLGSLPPGGGVVVEWPPSVTASAPGGSVISNPVEVEADDRARVTATHSVLVLESRVLDLAVDVDFDPLGERAVYDLTYGNRSALSTTGTRLVFPVPAGVVASGASDGGELLTGDDLAGPSVVWNLGTLVSGETGLRRVEVDLSHAIEGFLSRVFDAQIEGQGTFFEEVSRSRDARRFEDVSRTLAIGGTPRPVLPTNTLTTTLDVVNTAPAFLFDVLLQMRYPEGLLSTGEGSISDGGGCIGTSCEERELLTWNLGDLTPGQMLDVTLPPVVSGATPEGALVRFWARLVAGSFGQATASRAIPVGDDFDVAGPIQEFGIFVDGFESGSTSAWSQTVP